MQTALQAVMANLNDEVLVDMVCTHFGNKLFGLIACDDPAKAATEINAIRTSPMLRALPDEHKGKILELCVDCEQLNKMESDDG